MEEKVLDLLVKLCEDESVRNNLDMDLFEDDLIDSLAFAELLFLIEEDFGVIIVPSEVAREDINTASKIIFLIKERME